MRRLYVALGVIGWTFTVFAHQPGGTTSNDIPIINNTEEEKDQVDPKVNLKRELADQAFFDALERYRAAYAAREREKENPRKPLKGD